MMDLKAIARALGGEVVNGQVLAPGPGHSSEDRSLSIKLDPNAPDGILVHSFYGDDPIVCKDYFREKAGLPAFKPNGNFTNNDNEDRIAKAMAAAMAAPRARPKGTVVATYNYTDAGDVLLYKVLKLEQKDGSKTFAARGPNGEENLDGLNGRRVLYRWPELLQFPAATTFITEGEKDSDRLWSLNMVATTVAFGAWDGVDIETLRDRELLILEDNDEPGTKRAVEAATVLYPIANYVKIVRLPGLAHKEDVSDWLDKGHTVEKLNDFCNNTPSWEPSGEAKPTHTVADNAEPPQRLILSSAEFTESFETPNPLIENILMRKFIYALTGHVAKGKTAVALLCAAHVGLGRMLGNLEVEQGKALYLAGENFVDVQMRWIAMAQQMSFDDQTIPVYFRPGRFPLSGKMEKLRREVEELGGIDLIIVDSSAAFFEGDDENSNAQAGVHARRLRELTKFKGEPSVLVLCHPPKNAGDDNLQPRGGGALIAEWDGNLTATKDGSVTTIHWQLKIRGPDFAPVSYLLRSVTHERLKSKTGKLMPTVIAEPISAEREEEMVKAARSEENELMQTVTDHPHSSQAELARLLGWINRKGEPQRYRVNRIVKELKKQKLLEESRSGIELTSKGKAAKRQ